MQIREVNSFMVAPKCPGSEVRERNTKRGFGVPTLILLYTLTTIRKTKDWPQAKAFIAVATEGHKGRCFESSFRC